MPRPFVFLLAALFPFAALAQDAAAPIVFSQGKIVIRTQQREIPLTVQVRNPATLAREGIFVSVSLADGEGVLVLYGAPTIAQFPLDTTRGTFDLLYLDRHGAIQEILPAVEGGGGEEIFPSTPAFAALEIKAGSCEKLGIAPGHVASGPYFTPKRRTIEAAPR